MKALIQRVSHASVTVDGKITGQIQQGLLVLLGVEKHDTEQSCEKLLERVLKYRVFSDDAGKMNLSVKDIGGGVLLVSQFTLAADTKSGLRPSFSVAATPADAERLYQHGITFLQQQPDIQVGTGIFGADMKVELLNDGPVTFLLEV